MRISHQRSSGSTQQILKFIEIQVFQVDRFAPHDGIIPDNGYICYNFGMPNPLGNDKEIVRNKLIILYVIGKLDEKLCNTELTGLLSDMRLINYFSLQQLLAELGESGFIEKAVNHNSGNNSGNRNRTVYRTTDEGRRMLVSLIDLLPEGIRKTIDSTLADPSGGKKTPKVKISADFTPQNENEYSVSCSVKERDFTIIDIKLAAGSREDARTMASNWKNHSGQIYRDIIDSLIKKRT